MDGYHTSFREGQLPLSWKDADIVPIPLQRTIQDVNKHLHPIALTPILLKIAEDCVVHVFVMPAVLKKIDGYQLNKKKMQRAQDQLCKEQAKPEFDPICANRQTLETVNSVKLLGLNISSDLKWNAHVPEQFRKVSTRLYFKTG